MIQCTTRCRFLFAFVAALTLLLPQLTRAQNFDFRVINVISGSEGVDVHFNNLAQATIVDVDFEIASRVSQGLPSAGGQVNVKIAETGQGLANAFANNDLSVMSGHEYDAVVYGQAGNGRLAMLDRNKMQQPQAQKIMVRVLNTLTDGTHIDAHVGTVGNSPIASDLAEGESSNFVNVDAEAAAFIITQNGKTQPLVSLTGPFGIGTPFVTVIVAGTGPDDMKVYVNTDAMTDRTELIQLEEASYTNLRVVHLRPNQLAKAGDKLDIYFNRQSGTDTKVTDTLKYGFASKDFGPLFPSDFRVKFVPAGESPGTSVLSVDRALGSDTSYVVVLTQFTDLKPTPIILTRTPVEPIPGGLGSSKIRFVNASPFHAPITVVLGYGDDTLLFENVAFKSATEFRNITTGRPMSLKAYRQGQTEPFFTANPANMLVPTASYLTLISYGNEIHFNVTMLNESQTGLQQLRLFEPLSSVGGREVAAAFDLSAAPNPVTGSSAQLTFSLSRPASVRVHLVDALGRTVANVADRQFASGRAAVDLRTSDLAPGTYTCVLQGDDGSMATARIVVAH